MLGCVECIALFLIVTLLYCVVLYNKILGRVLFMTRLL